MSKRMEIPVRIVLDSTAIEGNLAIPKGSKGIVIFAHGSGSSRFSPRNQYVAEVLNKAGIATLLIDLLTPEEEQIDIQTAQYRFDIERLADRLTHATEWVKENQSTKNLNIGYFGSSTGAAAALIAAAKQPRYIRAVVSRGGRPDLAMDYISNVKAPTLFIVGGDDAVVIELNKKAMKNFPVENKLEIIQGATHLFEEPGKLEQVAKLAADWFQKQLTPHPTGSS
jgi:putative phosphoribosyl transferase